MNEAQSCVKWCDLLLFSAVFLTLDKHPLQKRLKGQLALLLDHKILSSQCDSVAVEFNNFYDNSFIMLRSVFEDFNEATDHVDDFWFEKAKISHFKTLDFVVKLALTLFHGQASFEQEFSISNNVYSNNMKEDTIMAKKYIMNHMNSHKLNLHTKETNKDLFKSVKSARSKC